MHVAGVVHQAAQAGMSFEPLATWQVNGLGSDVINRRSRLLLRFDAEVLHRPERRQPWPGQWQLLTRNVLDLEFRGRCGKSWRCNVPCDGFSGFRDDGTHDGRAVRRVW